MAIDKIREINHKWGEMLLEDVKDGLLNDTFWHYEPFSDDYWNQKYKIVLCNLESYGDVSKLNEADRILTLDKYKTWLVTYANKTAKNSALLLYCLYKRLQGESITEKQQLRDLYRDNTKLLSVLKNTAYMNLRKEENWDVPVDGQEIYRFLAPGWTAYKETDRSNEPNRKFTLEFIEALEPDIFIVTGTVGQDVLNKIYEGKIDLAWQGMYKAEKTLYVSINHPARIAYKYILERTNDICKGVLHLC
jgi:hypothetical protein